MTPTESEDEGGKGGKGPGTQARDEDFLCTGQMEAYDVVTAKEKRHVWPPLPLLRLHHLGGQDRADCVHTVTMLTMQTFQTLQDDRE